jgi:hypothetical protein
MPFTLKALCRDQVLFTIWNVQRVQKRNNARLATDIINSGLIVRTNADDFEPRPRLKRLHTLIFHQAKIIAEPRAISANMVRRTTVETRGQALRVARINTPCLLTFGWPRHRIIK